MSWSTWWKLTHRHQLSPLVGPLRLGVTIDSIGFIACVSQAALATKSFQQLPIDFPMSHSVWEEKRKSDRTVVLSVWQWKGWCWTTSQKSETITQALWRVDKVGALTHTCILCAVILYSGAARQLRAIRIDGIWSRCMKLWRDNDLLQRNDSSVIRTFCPFGKRCSALKHGIVTVRVISTCQCLYEM